MASVYDAMMVRGVMRYRRDKKFIKQNAVPDQVREALTIDNIVDENGLVIVDTKGAELNQIDPNDQKKLDEEKSENGEESKPDADETNTEDPINDVDESKDAESDDEDDSDETPVPRKKASKPQIKPAVKEPRFVSKVPQSKPGMGFPRKNGKTVDIFDGETPHTHIKLVGGHMVPLSTESFNTMSEKQIEQRLQELGIELRDFTQREPDRDNDSFSRDLDSDGDGLSDDDA